MKNTRISLTLGILFVASSSFFPLLPSMRTYGQKKTMLDIYIYMYILLLILQGK
jgi:hypothetical protein